METYHISQITWDVEDPAQLENLPTEFEIQVESFEKLEEEITKQYGSAFHCFAMEMV